MDDELEVFAQEALKYDTLGITEICRVRGTPDGIAITVGANSLWFSIEVVHRGVMYTKQYGEPTEHRPGFDAQSWADKAAEIIDGSTTKALELLFYCTAAASSLSAQVYQTTYENLSWYRAEFGEYGAGADAGESVVVLYDYVGATNLVLHFKEPTYAEAFDQAFRRAVEHGHDPDDITQDLIQCLDILDELGMSIH